MIAGGECYRHIPGWLLDIWSDWDYIIVLRVLGRDRRITRELTFQLFIPLRELIPDLGFDHWGFTVQIRLGLWIYIVALMTRLG